MILDERAAKDVLALVRKNIRAAEDFITECSRLTLRDYQVEVVRTVVESVLNHDGRSIVVMFPRQSGKNELQAQIEAYLMTLASTDGRPEFIKVSPTWKPQTLNAMRRLEHVLRTNYIARKLWKKESGYIYRIGTARMYFFSGQPSANIVGATATHLLEVDEAQDVGAAKYDREIAPMAAAANATRVFWGTAWTSDTLLARELRAARRAQKADGLRRVFVIGADAVAKEVPAWGKYVQGETARLGRKHPMVKAQYYSEEIDAEGGAFPPARQALMQGKHVRQEEPLEGRLYGAGLDMAGEDEQAGGEMDGNYETLANPRRDSTALTIFEVDLATMDDPLIRRPSYRAVNRYVWTGVKHARLYGQIRAILQLFDVRCTAVDATGVGTGMCSFLISAFGDRIIPFAFTSGSKSDLLWSFLGIVDSGRYQDFAPPDADFWREVRHCEFRIVPGPEKRVRWGVPDGRRDTHSGQLVHDDRLISAAMCAVLDSQEWSHPGGGFVVEAQDPLDEMDRGF